MVNENSGSNYTVEQLTVSNTSSSTIHTLDISEINAVGISPLDKKAYGIVPSGSNPNPLLVRFDDDEVHYVAEVEEKATQGTFDVHGDYIYGDDSGVWRVRRPDSLTGYASSSDSGISDQSSPTTLVSASSGQVADWAAIRADLGSGAANYLVGLDGRGRQVPDPRRRFGHGYRLQRHKSDSQHGFRKHQALAERLVLGGAPHLHAQERRRVRSRHELGQ